MLAHVAVAGHHRLDSRVRATEARLVDPLDETPGLAAAPLEVLQGEPGLEEVIDEALAGPGVVLELLVEIGLLELDLVVEVQDVPFRRSDFCFSAAAMILAWYGSGRRFSVASRLTLRRPRRSSS